jgi:hypothetical protein
MKHGRFLRKILAISTNLGWHLYYVERFNKTEHEDSAHLAMFYLFCALRDGEVSLDQDSNEQASS